MIVIKIQGGLGNQMYQYAVGYCLAKRYNVPLGLDCSLMGDIKPNEAHTARELELSVFIDDLKIINPAHIKLDVANKLTVFERIKDKFTGNKPLPYYKKAYFYEQEQYVFDKNIFLIPQSCYLTGYFQNELYFAHLEQEIRTLFSFKTELDKQNKQMLQQIDKTESVSIHVRRGDYAKNKTINAIHGLLTVDYYKKAIDYICKRVENPHFYIFSDDIDWCIQNLQFDQHQQTFISFNYPDKNYEDMRLMSHCKHNIIANSSFSWWGAWLNANPVKLIVAPQKWLVKQALHQVSGFFPKHWKVI